MAVKDVTDATFKKEVLESQTPIMVDFWAPWCGPCRMVSPVVEALAVEMKDRLTAVKINVDENPQTAAQYGIMSIPTLGIFKGGKMAHKVIGFMPKERLKAQIEKGL